MTDRDQEYDDCAFCAGRTVAHRGDPVTANPYPEPPPGTSKDDLYDYDHTLWAFGHQLGAQEPGGVHWYAIPEDQITPEAKARAAQMRNETREAFLAMPHCPECHGTRRCHGLSEPEYDTCCGAGHCEYCAGTGKNHLKQMLDEKSDGAQ